MGFRLHGTPSHSGKIASGQAPDLVCGGLNPKSIKMALSNRLAGGLLVEKSLELSRSHVPKVTVPPAKSAAPAIKRNTLRGVSNGRSLGQGVIKRRTSESISLYL